MRLVAFLFAAALLAPAVAAAQDTTAAQGSTPPWPPGTHAPPNPADQAVARACGPDIAKLCAGVQPGGGRILQCFKEHAADLSGECRSALSQMRASAGTPRFRRGDGSVPN